MKRTFLFRALTLFFMATLVALFFRHFVLENYVLENNAMAPEIHSGDAVLVTKYNFSLRLPFSTYELFRFRTPKKNEVVAYTLPYYSGETYVQRVAAGEGETVQFTKGVLLINGQSIGEPTPGAPDYGPVEVPPEHFFALNDSRLNNDDSRAWGPIPYSCLKGRAALLLLSSLERGFRFIR